MREELKQEKEEKRRLQRQLSRLRAQQDEQHPPARMETASSLDSMSVKSPSELREIIKVLRQQVSSLELCPLLRQVYNCAVKTELAHIYIY